jgi:hypothetical protein
MQLWIYSEAFLKSFSMGKIQGAEKTEKRAKDNKTVKTKLVLIV